MSLDEKQSSDSDTRSNEPPLITIISKYIYVLGIIQLIGLNVLGLFWLTWAKGIKERKAESRFWVLLLHSINIIALAVCCVASPFEKHDAYLLKVYSWHFQADAIIFYISIALLFIIIGLPIYWLMKPEIKSQFK